MQADLSLYAGKVMRIYARTESDTVVELLHSQTPPGLLFHHALVWHDVTEIPGVAPGWRLTGGEFVRPPAPAADHLVSPLARITDEIMALRRDFDLLRSQIVAAPGHSSP